MQTAQKGGDVVRSSQTHPETRSAPIAWPLRRKRRIPPRCNRPEPQKTCKNNPASQSNSLITKKAKEISNSRAPSNQFSNQFCNGIGLLLQSLRRQERYSRRKCRNPANQTAVPAGRSASSTLTGRAGSRRSAIRALPFRSDLLPLHSCSFKFFGCGCFD